MNAMKRNVAIVLGSYAAAVVVLWVSSPYIAIAVPAVGLLGAMLWGQRSAKKIAERTRREVEAEQQMRELHEQQKLHDGKGHPQAAAVSGSPAAGQPSPGTDARAQSAAAEQQIHDPELASALEYIGIIEDMILLEGEQNNLDDEIVQKTLALLARLNRLVPDLVALGDAGINHNIVRLVRKDLNSTINPFLRLSGEAKRQNRRLLLDGIKDVDSKLTFYTKTLEQKDLLELRTKAELMQQRYRLSD